MQNVQEGDKVKIKYEAKLENGEECFPENKDNTIELTIGEGKIFSSIEDGLKEMKEGESKTITVEPNEAFGPHLDNLIIDAPKATFKTDTDLSVGMRIKIDTPTDKVYYATIIKMTDSAVTLDLNHPLAGKKLMFTVTVIAIQKQ
jgi:FKBP-type peptidyl-prolyl cis-trans isomerase 2